MQKVDNAAGTISLFSSSTTPGRRSRSKAPNWLHKLYSARYEPPTGTKATPTPTKTSSEISKFDDRIFLNRMLGLSNCITSIPKTRNPHGTSRSASSNRSIMLMLAKMNLLDDFGLISVIVFGHGPKRHSERRLDSNETNQRCSPAMAEDTQSLHQEGEQRRRRIAFQPPACD